MNLPLSRRLRECCKFIRPGDRVADIGCDHGYLGLHLLQEGVASFVFAADVNEGPLQSALRNAQKYGLQEKMAFYLSDGVKNVPRDFDVMVCAGMGADTMVSILEAAPWLKSKQYRLVLQCQSKTPMLREFLSEQGWSIAQETVLRDGRFLYTVMEVIWDPEAPRLTVGGCYFPPALAACTAAEVPEYKERVLFSLERAVTYGKDPQMVQALEELHKLKENDHDNG